MKQLKLLKLSFLFVLSSLSSIAQMTLGEATLSYVKAKPLFRSESIAMALRGTSYLARVGGVAFDKVAIPAEGLYVSSLQLQYNSLKEDGKRFSVTINGSEADADIYDWELVPIAKYANSIHTACFTLFGELDDNTKAETIQHNGGRILNYHPELANTLLGLRLFQLDILIVEPTLSIDLPKKSNLYILGKGETSPNVLSNRLGYNKFKTNFEKNNQQYRSYLICDQNRAIKFGIQNNSLFITSQPFYYFWQYNTDQLSYRKKIYSDIDNELLRVLRQGYSLPEDWLLKEIQKEFNTLYGGNSSSEYIELVKELKAIKLTEGTKSYLSELKLTLSDLRIENSPKQIIYLSNLSTTLSSQPQLFKNINPTVWNAGAKTMRYAAFFRYCKAKFPEQWKNFMAQMKRIEISPPITTPTVLKME